MIGQLDFPDNAPNLVEGKEFNTISTATGASGSAVLDFQRHASASLRGGYGEQSNSRMHRIFPSAQEGVTADIVIGQPGLHQQPGSELSIRAIDAAEAPRDSIKPTALVGGFVGGIFM